VNAVDEENAPVLMRGDSFKRQRLHAAILVKDGGAAKV